MTISQWHSLFFTSRCIPVLVVLCFTSPKVMSSGLKAFPTNTFGMTDPETLYMYTLNAHIGDKSPHFECHSGHSMGSTCFYKCRDFSLHLDDATQLYMLTDTSGLFEAAEETSDVDQCSGSTSKIYGLINWADWHKSYTGIAMVSSHECFGGALLVIAANQNASSMWSVVIMLEFEIEGLDTKQLSLLGLLMDGLFSLDSPPVVAASFSCDCTLNLLMETIDGSWVAAFTGLFSASDIVANAYSTENDLSPCQGEVVGLASACSDDGDSAELFILCKKAEGESYEIDSLTFHTTAFQWQNDIPIEYESFYYRDLGNCTPVVESTSEVGKTLAFKVGVGVGVGGGITLCTIAGFLIVFTVIVKRRGNAMQSAEVTLDAMELLSQESRIDDSLQLGNCKLVKPEEFDLLIEPSSVLTFKLGTHLASVGVPLEDEFTLSNETKKKHTFHLMSPKSEKYSLKVKPRCCTLKPGTEVTIAIQITVICTTVVDTDILIMLDPDEKKSKKPMRYTYIKIKFETAISTSLDPNEIEIVREIGEGAYSTVHLGKWRGQEVAVKALKTQKGEGILSSFAQEVAILESVRYPQIVHFFGAVKIPGHLSIITEYFPLGNLTSCMKKTKLSNLLKLKCVIDCAKGMTFLHQLSILHRDLKPDNLLVSSLNVDVEVNCKINDFGTSRNINKSEQAQYYTCGVGTPVYMAPEVLSEGKYNEKADVYSFAVLVYHVFTEQTPYMGLGSIWKICEFVVAGSRLPLDGVPADIARVVSQCWATEYTSRPAFSDVVSLLEPALNSMQE
ncbi:protein serine/threonine kinase [Pelomyxa schiedti]|nr:protein serine/threonine kinase [Pelomyxa schiedti]